MTALSEAPVLSGESVERRAERLAAERAATLQDWHMLLEFLRSRPDAPLPAVPEIRVPVSAGLSDEEARNVVGLAAQAMGVEPVSPAGQFGAEIRVGRVSYYVFAVPQAEVARSAEVRRLGVAAFEEASGSPVPESTLVEMAPAPQVLPVAQEPEAEPKTEKKVPTPRSSRSKAAASTKSSGGEAK